MEALNGFVRIGLVQLDLPWYLSLNSGGIMYWQHRAAEAWFPLSPRDACLGTADREPLGQAADHGEGEGAIEVARKATPAPKDLEALLQDAAGVGGPL